MLERRRTKATDMEYFYFKQFKRSILQFMEIFRGTQVKTGTTSDGTIKTIDVPIIYGSLDKVTASILAQNTNNLPIRVPIMSAYMNGISQAMEQYVGIDTLNELPYTPRGGRFPEDVKTFTQLRPIPYKLNFDLHILTSNNEQMFQILEQTLCLFNPSIQIQVSDALYDGGKITIVTLNGITNNENFPMSTDRRSTSYSLSFETTCYLTIPAKLRNDRIHDISIRIANMSDNKEFDDDIMLSVMETLQ